jgi:hypothetical protein
MGWNKIDRFCSVQAIAQMGKPPREFISRTTSCPSSSACSDPVYPSRIARVQLYGERLLLLLLLRIDWKAASRGRLGAGVDSSLSYQHSMHHAVVKLEEGVFHTLSQLNIASSFFLACNRMFMVVAIICDFDVFVSRILSLCLTI